MAIYTQNTYNQGMNERAEAISNLLATVIADAALDESWYSFNLEAWTADGERVSYGIGPQKINGHAEEKHG